MVWVSKSVSASFKNPGRYRGISEIIAKTGILNLDIYPFHSLGLGQSGRKKLAFLLKFYTNHVKITFINNGGVYLFWALILKKGFIKT